MWSSCSSTLQHSTNSQRTTLRARIMHKFSNAVPPSSAVMALRFLALLDVLQECACGALRPANT